MRAALYIRVSTEDQVEFFSRSAKTCLIEYAKRIITSLTMSISL